MFALSTARPLCCSHVARPNHEGLYPDDRPREVSKMYDVTAWPIDWYWSIHTPELHFDITSSLHFDITSSLRLCLCLTHPNSAQKCMEAIFFYQFICMASGTVDHTCTPTRSLFRIFPLASARFEDIVVPIPHRVQAYMRRIWGSLRLRVDVRI